MNQAHSGCWRSIGVLGGDHSCKLLASVVHCRNCDVLREAARQLFDQPAGIETAPEEPAAPARVGATPTVLTLRLGQRWLGLPSSHVVEVTPERPVRRVAHRCRGTVEGVVNIRGELHVCVALSELLGLGRIDSGGHGRLVLVGLREGSPLAFRCDQVGELMEVAAGQLEPSPETLHPALQDCVIGMLAQPPQRIALLDGDALLAQLEQGLYS